MIWVFIVLFSSYFVCMMAFVYGFRKVPIFSAEEVQPQTRFSVIIPFRNEAENLPKLLRTIKKINYPSELFEIIFVNDASEDTSESIVSEAIQNSALSLKLLQNKRVSASPKKDAITEAIKTSNFEWIVTTDADCELPKNWLKSLDAYIQTSDSVMICGPVIYESNGSLIENFQQLDGFSLQAVTVGSFGFKNPLLSNGANLAYKKSTFLKVNGFSENDHIASGDDIFLLEKMKKKFPDMVYFLKSEESIVSTIPQKTWKDVINQRIRWASKTSKQKNFASLLLGLLVFLVNISVLALPFFMVFCSENLIFYLNFLCFKIITDYLVIQQAGIFFKAKFSLHNFIWQTFVYAVITVLVVVGSLRGSYSWKGRSVK